MSNLTKQKAVFAVLSAYAVLGTALAFVLTRIAG